MARVLCIDDFIQYAEMMATMLHAKGKHEARAEIVPFDIKRVESFNPELIVLSLVRKSEALGKPLSDFYTQVDGARAFRTLSLTPSLGKYPIIITSIAVLETEVPKDLRYVAFLEIPVKLDNLISMVDRVTATSRSRLVKE